METVRLTREELYARVWSEPMRTLAKHYGLSDVGLAKTCKRLRVPVPGRGYWAKKAAGHSVKPKLLPILPPNQTITDREVTLAHSLVPVEQPSLPLLLRQLIEFERSPENLIVVSDSLRTPHPLVKQTADTLREKQRERNVFNTTPFLQNYERPHLDIQVSRDQLQRSLRVMDALVKAFEERGWKVSLGSRGKDHDKKSYVIVLGRSIPFGIREKIKKVENKVVDIWDPKYKDVPSGRLSLVIRNTWGYGVDKSWDDTPNRLIDDRLNEFAIAILTLAYEDLELEARRENSERDSIVEARRRAELARLRELELQRVRTLEQQALDWEKSQRLRSYVNAVCAAAQNRPEGSPPIPDINAWITWAEDQANRIDPLRKSFQELILNDHRDD
jgi:hypothetical protein